jgi:type IV secretory pathway VirB9-like protein
MSKENKNKKKATKASKSIPSGSQTDPYKPKPTNKGQRADNPVRIYADGESTSSISLRI